MRPSAPTLGSSAMPTVPEVQNPTRPATALPCTPRRKRRRTPAAGAANDCFTCSHEKVCCDRKRPYCTPCLETGKDCAGYKTTLTWGVGVASRGKLRGLSLPIAGNKQQPLSQLRNSARKRDSVNSELSRRRLQRLGPTSGPAPSFLIPPLSADNASPRPVTLSMTWPSVPSALTISAPSQVLSSQNSEMGRPSADSMLGDPPISSNSDRGVSTASARPVDMHTEQNFGSIPGSLAPSETMGQFSAFESPRKCRSYSWNSTSSAQGQDAGYWFSWDYRGRSPSPNRSDDLSPSQLSHPQQPNERVPLDSVQVALAWPPIDKKAGSDTYAEESQELEYLSSNPGAPDVPSRDPLLGQNALRLSPFSGVSTIGKTPRMQYLINYYTEVISPVIVAFDGPTNPYRSYILRLASGSETLQHAISALSASNLRQRRESGELSTGKTGPARRSSMAHLTLTDKAWQSAPGFLSVEDQKREENYHKNATVQLVQRQFADPSQHKDDSILATLLIVCLFHICESGVAKFRTHFAGAKKLLGMRECGSILKSNEAKWFTRMFTWFDAMTATVNDRAGQMQDGLLDLSSLSDGDWTLENLAGCDGKLFKVIAKLGRLNILSQKTFADKAPVTPSCVVPTISSDLPFWNNFDRNGWTINDSKGIHRTLHEAYPDMHTQFGREWHDTRNSLMSWTLDVSLFGSGSPDMPVLTPEQQLDLLNISESFRFSALIYMERLALSSVASSDPQIQTLVQKALHYITQVRSDVYLLWPLFVTGSECVTDADRHIIRQRCLDIQKDSGFSNNASCLKLLEKIWASHSNASRNTIQPSGFRWRSVMESNVLGGEYIVV